MDDPGEQHGEQGLITTATSAVDQGWSSPTKRTNLPMKRRFEAAPTALSIRNWTFGAMSRLASTAELTSAATSAVTERDFTGLADNARPTAP